MTSSRNLASSESRSALNETLLAGEHEAHFLVMRWMRICLGSTPIRDAHRRTSPVKAT